MAIAWLGLHVQRTTKFFIIQTPKFTDVVETVFTVLSKAWGLSMKNDDTACVHR